MLTKNEAPVVLIFSGKRFISLKKLMYLHKSNIFKRRMNGSVLQSRVKRIRKVKFLTNEHKIIPNVIK
jgi:hypothetical protein